MTIVAMENLEGQLGKYLEQAHEGERVVVTRNGRPFVVLSGVSDARDTDPIWQMVESGAASWNGGKPLGASKPVEVQGKTAAERVLEDRR